MGERAVAALTRGHGNLMKGVNKRCQGVQILQSRKQHWDERRGGKNEQEINK